MTKKELKTYSKPWIPALIKSIKIKKENLKFCKASNLYRKEHLHKTFKNYGTT